jgi:hypothetical protein
MLAATGEVVIQDQRHEVDFAVPRDHFWGPRRESVKRGCGNFDDDHIGDFYFLFQTRNDTLERSEVTYGYLLDAGELVRLIRGEGRYPSMAAGRPHSKPRRKTSAGERTSFVESRRSSSRRSPPMPSA